MKKLLSIAFCAAVASGFADGEPSANEAVLGTVGVTAITTSLSNVIVAVSYDDLAGGTGMVYSNLVKTANLTEGDRLVEFRNDKYTGWVLEKSGEVLYWKETTEVFQDASGKQITLQGSAAETVRGAVGTGIWLVRNKPTDSDENPIPFYIYGKSVSSLTSTTVAGKWTLIGNPTQGQVTIGPTTVPDVQTGDQIVTAEEDGKLHYHTFIGSQWTGSPITIDPGLGFWIKTQAETTITWTTSEE